MKKDFSPKRGDRSKLNFNQLELLENQILPTAREWLDDSSLRSHAESTLMFWGEAIPKRKGSTA